VGRRGSRGMCRRCGTRRRGNAAAASQPVTSCAVCGIPVCARHIVWDDQRGTYLCTKCARGEVKAG